ncbi:ISxcC1 transposase [Xanthomonas bromi]|nr:ISxcC1 transposase [Xanthomonas bromi]
MSQHAIEEFIERCIHLVDRSTLRSARKAALMRSLLRLQTRYDTHECLEIVVDQPLRADDVAETVARLVVQRGKPEAIKVDNGSEFAGKVMDRWAYEAGVELDFFRRGTPTDNAMVESSNGRLRQERLNEHWFLSLADARRKIEAWRKFYNEERPHSALAWKTPAAFARAHGARANSRVRKEVEISTD